MHILFFIEQNAVKYIFQVYVQNTILRAFFWLPYAIYIIKYKVYIYYKNLNKWFYLKKKIIEMKS